MTQTAVEQARQVILEDEVSQPLYVVADPTFNTGIVGLVSSRLTEEFYRPTLVAQLGDTHTKGSARSIPEFHITRALDECADLLERYGGHAAAAGFTIRNQNLPEFQSRLLTIARRELADEELTPTLVIDAALNLRGIHRRRVEELLAARSIDRQVDEQHIGLQIVDGLDRLRPFGYHNATPVFATDGMQVKGKRLVGSEGDHLKLVLHDGKQTWDAIAFRKGDWRDHLPTRVDVAYTLEVNQWRGRHRLQLNVKDLRPAEST
jgi:single-stranded-DNA-specific exonuclease